MFAHIGRRFAVILVELPGNAFANFILLIVFCDALKLAFSDSSFEIELGLRLCYLFRLFAFNLLGIYGF